MTTIPEIWAIDLQSEQTEFLADCPWLTERQALLCAAMSCISEDCWCAGWLIGLEFDVWERIHGADPFYGMSDAPAELLALCRDLSAEIGGWVEWRDASPLTSEWGPYFVPADEWARKLETLR